MFLKKKIDKTDYSNLFKTVIEYGLYKTMNRVSEAVDIEITSSDNVGEYTVPDIISRYKDMTIMEQKSYIHGLWMNYLKTRNTSNLNFMYTFNRNIIECKTTSVSELEPWYRRFVHFNLDTATYLKVIVTLLDISTKEVVDYAKRLIRQINKSEVDEINLYVLYNNHIQHFRDNIMYYIIKYYKAVYGSLREINANILPMITCLDAEFGNDEIDGEADITYYNKHIRFAINSMSKFKESNAAALWSNSTTLQRLVDLHIPSSIKDKLCLSSISNMGNKDLAEILTMCDRTGYGVLKYIEELFEFQEWIYIKLLSPTIGTAMSTSSVLKEVIDTFFTSIFYSNKPLPQNVLDSIPYHIESEDMIQITDTWDTHTLHMINRIISKMVSKKKSTIYKYAKKYM